MKINVVDSIMGSGKSSWAIKYMNENKDKKFIYITPFLDEVERIKTSCTKKIFKEPTNRGKGKLDSLKKLISKGENIASTHVLFSFVDEETIGLLKINNYVLILDEVMSVIEPINIDKKDLEILFNEKMLILKEDGKLIWNKEFHDYEGEFKDIKILAEYDRLIHYTNTILMWRFPVDVFKAFKEVWILTYLFDGQLQKAYYDLYKQEYQYFSMKNMELSEYEPNQFLDSGLINIYEGKMNAIGQDNFDLSFSWYDKNKSNKYIIDILKNNKQNYLRNVTKSNSKKAMWTTYKDFESKIKDKNYNSKSFVVYNSRATNIHIERENLAYLVNRFINPIYIGFFRENGIKLDEEKFALSELLQWIWRSKIRTNQPINLYIPSSRMRRILKEWYQI